MNAWHCGASYYHNNCIEASHCKGAPMLKILPTSSTSQKHYPLFLLSLPIILIKFFLAILQAAAFLELQDSKSVYCISTERSIYSNRTVSSAVILDH